MTKDIQSPSDLLIFIDHSFMDVRSKLANLHRINDKINVDQLNQEVKLHIKNQADKAGVSMTSPLKVLRGDQIKDFTAFEVFIASEEISKFKIGLSSNPESDQTRKEALKFKNWYFSWARNVVVTLNKIKMIRQWHWLDVKQLAKCLSTIDITEDCAYYIFEKNTDFLDEELWKKFSQPLE